MWNSVVVTKQKKNGYILDNFMKEGGRRPTFPSGSAIVTAKTFK